MRTAEEVIQNPALVSEVIEGLNAKRANEKYGAAKVLLALSEKAPEILYPRFDFFTALLDHEKQIFTWNAIRILANLARVDSEDRCEAIFEKYFKPIRGPVMITAANVIIGGAAIASAKPGLAQRIANEILKVEKAHYATAECRNIALGHAITAFGAFFDKIEDQEPVLKLIRKQLKNPRPAVRKKAEKFLARHQAAPAKANAARA